MMKKIFEKKVNRLHNRNWNDILKERIVKITFSRSNQNSLIRRIND